MYHPWRNETELKGNSETFKEQFIKQQTEILQIKQTFDKMGSEIEDIMETVNE